MKDIVQIEMEPTENNQDGTIAATLRCGNVVLNVRNGIDKYVLYILLKEFQNHAS